MSQNILAEIVAEQRNVQANTAAEAMAQVHVLKAQLAEANEKIKLLEAQANARGV